MRLIETRHWKHPGEHRLARVIPWFMDPVEFLADARDMERQSRSLDQLADDQETARIFHLARLRRRGPVDLPWLDVDNAILIAICRYAGDDTAIVLDYRVDSSEPRVVGSDIWSDPGQLRWRTIAPTFTAFAEALGLDDEGHAGE
ncbi:hypothetical protein ACQPZJ_27390 [Actinoplanes sp. CA-054009]